tara:strand:+ start:785 stop:976 length:192 start_codon:yes stop_codon:yes gene_type:complete
MSKTKDWATSKVEQELDGIKDKLVNNELTLDDAASQIENIDNLGLVCDSTDYDELAYLLKHGD